MLREKRQGRNDVGCQARSVKQIPHSKKGGMGGAEEEVGRGVGAPLHEGQQESGTLSTLSRNLLREEQ